jgi:hypothetical protein
MDCITWAQIERVSLHGITEAELKIAKANLLSDLEADHIEKEQLESEGFCNQVGFRVQGLGFRVREGAAGERRVLQPGWV